MGSPDKDRTLIKVAKLSVEYLRDDAKTGEARGHRALADVSFEIGRGETLGLMGESGCGKSTLALALLGLLARERAHVTGSIAFGGRELVGLSERAFAEIRGARIAMIYQEPEIALSPFLRAGEQIAEVVHAHRDWRWKQCRDAAFAALERMKFGDTERIYRSYPHQLSGGQRQRVVFAQALACEPELIVADEPTASLDARNQAEAIELLREARRETGASLLLISHTPEIQASLADRLMVMSEGAIAEHGKFDELYWNPKHACTRAMLRPSGRAAERMRKKHATGRGAEQEQLVR